MGFKAIICPVCGSVSITETENGRFKCLSCDAVFDSETAASDVKYISDLLNSSSFDLAESASIDLLSKPEYELNPHVNWLAFLAKYKIRFVNDPKTGERKPVFYSDRVFARDCVLDDENYKRALKGAQREKYQRYGELIEAIRLELCERMSNEDDADVFISFKSTEEVIDSEGIKRDVDTFDQKKGQEIYDYLTQKGYKVFFSPVSIGKGKVFGEKYEPKIFAALASCRAMVLIGTKKSYIVDGWVRDEWTRYLYFMNNARAKKTSRLKKQPDTLFYVFDRRPPQDLPTQISEIEGIDCSSAYYLDELYKSIKNKIGAANNGIERARIEKGERVKKEKVDIESIKTITLGEGVIAKKRSVIASGLQIKSFGENKVGFYDADTQKILDGAFASLEGGNFTFARHEFEDVLSSSDNASALYGKILLSVYARNDEEFVLNSDRFPDGEFALYHKLMSCANKDEATRVTDLFLAAFKKCCEKVETAKAAKFFRAVTEYNLPEREEAAAILREAIPALMKAHDPGLPEIVDAYLGTIAPDNVDLYIKECLFVVECALKESSFSLAESYNEKVLQVHENNHAAMFNRLYLKTNSRGSKDLKNKIFDLDVGEIETLISGSGAKDAAKDLTFFVKAYLDKAEDDACVVRAIENLKVLLKYDFPSRFTYLDKLADVAVIKAAVLKENGFDETIDYILKSFDSDDVDKYISYMNRAAKAARSLSWFTLAEKYFKKVIELDNANVSALYEVLVTGLNMSSGNVVRVAAKFADPNGKAVKNLEELLKFSLSAGDACEESLRFSNLITQFSSDILTAYNKKLITADIADKAYLNIIRYVPQSDKKLTVERLQKIADAMLSSRNFDLADKYYGQILVEDSENFGALLGKVLSEEECVDVDELSNSDLDFTETKSYIRAYRAADRNGQKTLNLVYQRWLKNKEEKRRADLVEKVLSAANARTKRDLIKSPVKLSDIAEFNELIKTADESFTAEFKFIESMQRQYMLVEKERKFVKDSLKKIGE